MSKSTLGKFTVISSALILFGLSFSSHSAVYKCQVNGKTVYQSSTCFSGKQTVLNPTKHDTGLHASWFARPKMLPDTARCQSEQCQCDEQTMPLTSDSVDNVATSLNAIINDWQRHQQAYNNYQELSEKDKLTSPLKGQVATSACNIAMHQTLINQAYLNTLSGETKPTLTDAQRQAIQTKCETAQSENSSSDETNTQLETCITQAQDEAIAEAQTTEPDKADIVAKYAQPVAILKLKNPYLSE